jgi:hypothetical protein
MIEDDCTGVWIGKGRHQHDQVDGRVPHMPATTMHKCSTGMLLNAAVPRSQVWAAAKRDVATIRQHPLPRAVPQPVTVRIHRLQPGQQLYLPVLAAVFSKE